MEKSRTWIIIGFMIAAAASRLLPHPPNVAPITAMALFGGAYFSPRWLGLVATFGAMILSDLLLGFHDQMLFVYLCFGLTVWFGSLLKSRLQWAQIAATTFLSSTLFFVVTNLGVWLFTPMYPKTFGGLTTCYALAIPFFKNSLLGDGFYAFVLFGGFALLERFVPKFRIASSTAS